MNKPRTLFVEGWRGIPHSYAIVNQFQCLQLLLEPNLTLRHTDLRFAHPKWTPMKGIFSPVAEAAIAGIPAPKTDEIPDAIYRISFPYDIRPSVARRTVVFGTAEHLSVPNIYITGQRSLVDACAECDAVIVTPSNWSREGFLASGAPPDRVKVVPHGVDTSLFHPALPQVRTGMRQQLGLNGFTFLSLGAMTNNKNIGPMLQAFAIVAQKHPQVQLVLKGVGALYPSQAMVAKYIEGLSQAEAALIQPRLKYLEQTLSFSDIAHIYQCADAYVSPYAAEGFNMPVLEALASGLPVICTRGGSTDDFTNDQIALRINATRHPLGPGVGEGGFTLAIEFDHLVHQMMMVVEHPAIAANARINSPAFVANGFTWPQVTQKLLKVLFEGE